MGQPKVFSAVVLGLVAFSAATLLDTPTPQLGWNSYNFYNCYPNETLILDNAHGLVESGLADAGYTYLTVDCGWPSPDRDEEGRLVWNQDLFPSGVKVLEEEIHGLGLKFGVYSGGGYRQCGNASLPASLDFEDIDAASFAEWNADSLKYDNCFATNTEDMVEYHDPEYESPDRFQNMSRFIDDQEREILYQVCQWGCGTDLGQWAPPTANSYRISNDITNHWRSIWRIANQATAYTAYTGPGSFPDLDMLIVGLNVLSEPEEAFHFTLWSLLKSPLIIGVPFDGSIPLSERSLSILQNSAVLGINQDSLASPAALSRRYTEEEWDVWVGDLSEDRKVLAVMNWRNESQAVSVDIERTMGVKGAQGRDVWAEEDIEVGSIYEAALGPHELRLLVLSEIQHSTLKPVSTGYHAAFEAQLSGSASLEDCPEGDCAPINAKITKLTRNSTASFTGITASSPGVQTLAVDYVNYEVALETAWEWGDNTLNLTVAVNGNEGKRWAFPLSGADWFETGRLMIEVDGFETGNGNEVSLRGLSAGADGPHVVGLEVIDYREE